MLYMNEYEISDVKRRHTSHPILSKAARFLENFKDEVNAHSDGWCYWSPPVKAARKLMQLVLSANATEAEFKAALTPIKSFYTRRGNAAGMKFPEVI